MLSRTSRGPVLARRRLRSELRQLREKAGLTPEYVTREMVWSVSKLVRIENGAVGTSVNDTKALLALYGIIEPETVADLVGLAADSRRRMWWAKYRDHVPAAFLEFIGLEDDATQIRHYNASVVPGLLQTAEYARTLAGTDAVAAARQVEIRMQRQRLLFDRPDPPEYLAILDESVLYRPLGDETVLRDQLNALLDHVREDHIELVVVPTGTAVHPVEPVGFVMLGFADKKDAPIVIYDQPGSDVAAEAPVDVARFAENFDRLLSLGLRGAEAIDSIKRARDKIVGR
jgi:Domain of unknown function (DUF5753)/Helix-turn-helix domain